MFGVEKIPFVISLIITSGAANEKHHIPVMYGQCQTDEYLKYIGSTDSYEYTNRTDFDYENFVMHPVGSGANLYFRSGEKEVGIDGSKITSETHPFKPMKLSEICIKHGICQKVDDYPEANISILVEEYKKKRHLNNIHFEAWEAVEELTSVEEFCFISTMEFEPQAAQDEKNDWYYIVNIDSHKQKIRTNVCDNLDVTPVIKVYSPWTVKCIQEHYYKSFKALSWNGEVINKMFKVPNYCSCVIKRN